MAQKCKSTFFELHLTWNSPPSCHVFLRDANLYAKEGDFLSSEVKGLTPREEEKISSHARTPSSEFFCFIVCIVCTAFVIRGVAAAAAAA